jgi:hydroxymethylpyrimidine/phosphomethylpyrimidine kinase
VSGRPPVTVSARKTPIALTIAGSDSGGGAGIQADLKAFANLGVHGASAITAITAQSTVAVSAIHLVPAEVVLAQIRAVVSDLGVDAVKVGMLGGEQVIAAVAQALDELPREIPVVVDPVMVSESGARLLEAEAQAALIGQILAREIVALGPASVVLTGGHGARASDLLLLPGPAAEPIWIDGPRHPDGAAHGSGCTHSSTLAAALALGYDVEQAARTARSVAASAVADGLRDVGAGAGPVDVLGLADRRASAAKADPGLS